MGCANPDKDKNGLWCPTQVDDEGYFVKNSKHYGFCNDYCLERGKGCSHMGPSINNITHLGVGDLPKGDFILHISLFSKICDKGEGGVKNLKTWVTSIMDDPLIH